MAVTKRTHPQIPKTPASYPVPNKPQAQPFSWAFHRQAQRPETPTHSWPVSPSSHASPASGTMAASLILHTWEVPYRETALPP